MSIPSSVVIVVSIVLIVLIILFLRYRASSRYNVRHAHNFNVLYISLYAQSIYSTVVNLIIAERISVRQLLRVVFSRYAYVHRQLVTLRNVN